MEFQLLFTAIISAQLVFCETITNEYEVLILTKNDFEEALTSYESILVDFYTPWCEICKELEPEIAKAAKQLKAENSRIRLGKVDATIETELAEKYEVRDYPTLKLFTSNNVEDYNGRRNADDLVKWLKKQTSPSVVIIESIDDLNKMTKSAEEVIIGFFSDSNADSAKVFLEVAGNSRDHYFGFTSNKDVFSEYKVVRDSVIILQKFDAQRYDLTDDLTVENIKAFIEANSFPLVVDYTREIDQKMARGEYKEKNVVLISKPERDFEKTLQLSRTAAREFKNKVLFFTFNTHTEEGEAVMNYLGVKKEHAPEMRLITVDVSNKRNMRYKPENADITAENIINFVQGVLDGKVKRHLLSQDLPEDWNNTQVKVLVGSNFEEVVFQKDKDVLVKFYAPWSEECKRVAPIFEQLAEQFKDDYRVVIAKIDITVNEVEYQDILRLPTIRLYRKKTNEVVDYDGEITLEGLSLFIQSGDLLEYNPEKENTDDEGDQHDVKKDEL